MVVLLLLLCPACKVNAHGGGHGGGGVHGGSSGGFSSGHSGFSSGPSGFGASSGLSSGHSGFGSSNGFGTSGFGGGSSFGVNSSYGHHPLHSNPIAFGGFAGSGGGYNSYGGYNSVYPNQGNYQSSSSYSDTSYHPNPTSYYTYASPGAGFSNYGNENSHSFFWGRDYEDTPEFDPIPNTLVPSDQATMNRSHYLLNSYFRIPAPESLPKCMARIDEELVNLDGEGRIGTFDTDFYSQELLAIKRDYDAGLSIRGSISPAREAALRKQLAGLEKDIQRQR